MQHTTKDLYTSSPESSSRRHPWDWNAQDGNEAYYKAQHVSVIALAWVLLQLQQL